MSTITDDQRGNCTVMFLFLTLVAGTLSMNLVANSSHLIEPTKKRRLAEKTSDITAILISQLKDAQTCKERLETMITTNDLNSLLDRYNIEDAYLVRPLDQPRVPGSNTYLDHLVITIATTHRGGSEFVVEIPVYRFVRNSKITCIATQYINNRFETVEDHICKLHEQNFSKTVIGTNFERGDRYDPASGRCQSVSAI